MRISVYARGDIAVPFPGQTRPFAFRGGQYMTGGPAKYIGREYVPPVNLRKQGGKHVVDEPAKYVATAEPFECDSDSYLGKRILRHMTRKRCRRTGEYPFWPADKATAQFFGIPFVSVEVIDGEAVPKKKATHTPKPKDD
jgi:hypothetical protein